MGNRLGANAEQVLAVQLTVKMLSQYFKLLIVCAIPNAAGSGQQATATTTTTIAITTRTTATLWRHLAA